MDNFIISKLNITNRGMVYKFAKEDNEFIFIYCDGKLLSELGYKTMDVVGKKLVDIFPNKIVNQKRQFFQKAWDGEFVQYDFKFNEVVYNSFLTPFFNEGKVIEVVGTFIKPNEVTEANFKEIIFAKEEAEKANIAKSEFLSKMSHELRTPLNGIVGFAQLLEIDESLNEQQQDFVQEILNGGTHLLNLINEILDVSRIETGKLKVSIEEVPLLSIVNECIKIFQPLAKKKNISIRIEMEQWQNSVVLADPIRLKQILINLLDNAIKYNREFGKVTITSELIGEEQIIHISDTGIGISIEDYNKIFVPFYRVEGTSKEGTGLGLSLVKQLVLLMDGKISVKSKKDEGSIFSFSLPLTKNSKPVLRWGEQIDDIKSSSDHSDHYCILYIEDNESNLQLVKNIIKSEPAYTLLVARTGKEGLEIATHGKVDLVLLDLNLPDIHGFKVFEKLKLNEQTKDIPIIAISANAMPQDVQRTLEKGFVSYLSKPIDIQQFLATISEMLMNTINLQIPNLPILSTGPYGEEAVSAKTLQLSLGDLKKIKKKKYMAAISMHYAENDWSRSQVDGLKSTFKKMGIEILVVKNANFKWEKQVVDLEAILALKPDILVSIPVDPIMTANAYKKASRAGVKLVFMENVPIGLRQGEDYVSVVTADNYRNGIEAAHITSEKLGKKGKVGIIYHKADFFVTKQRTEAFEKTIHEHYPDIEIVARGGIVDPGDGEKVATDILSTHVDLDAIFVVWDVPAEGAIKAARTLGRHDIIITTMDLGYNVALDLANDGFIKGLGAQLPFHQGVAEAILAGYAMLEKQAPAYVAVPALKVTKENVLEAWKIVYNEDAPTTIRRALRK